MGIVSNWIALLETTAAAVLEKKMWKVRWAILAASLCFIVSTQAAETATYTYDVFGRLRKVQVSGGPANAVERTFDYDATDNRTQIQVSGSSNSGTVSISASGAVANTTTAGVNLGVSITGARSPTGVVTFTENGVFLGSAFVSDGQARVFLEGFSLGIHTITASYSGDGVNSPFSHTFTIKVQNLSWLPAVLEILLSD